jgi:hypothetical protein
VEAGKARRAACVWLYCLVEALGGTHATVRSRLLDAQVR